MTFASLPIDPRFHAVLSACNITIPSPIQEKAIPIACEGEDLIAIAQTGTGKTLAFGLPALTRIATLPRGKTHMLVLAPTRELAQQVHDVLHPYAKAIGLSTACVYGGVGMGPQAAALRRGTSIIVACPGRLLDHINRGNVNFKSLDILVLDEADRMLDMGFLPDIRRIIREVPNDRQTMMFSATFPEEISRLADSLMFEPQRVEVGAIAKPAELVRQGVYGVATQQHKTDLLKTILRQKGVISTIVFLRSKRATDRLATILTRDGFAAESIHGGHSQNRRKSAIDGFKAGRHRILVATDVAARGLDVQGISHVVNYDIPTTSDDYIHRIGRTARANASGDALTFVTPEDTESLHLIERAIGKRIDRHDWEGSIHIAEPRQGGSFRPASTSSRPRPSSSSARRRPAARGSR